MASPGDVLLEIMDDVKEIVQSPDLNGTRIIRLINRGMLAVSAAVRLPDLLTIEDVATSADAAWVSMPEEYQTGLHAAYSVGRKVDLKVAPSLAWLRRYYPDLTMRSSVAMVCGVGSRLYYQPWPSAPETIQIHYFRFPDSVAENNAKPFPLPPHLAAPLLASYACREIFDSIEDGMDGAKVNTQRHDAKFREALAELSVFVGPFAENVMQPADVMGCWS